MFLLGQAQKKLFDGDLCHHEKLLTHQTRKLYIRSYWAGI